MWVEGVMTWKVQNFGSLFKAKGSGVRAYDLEWKSKLMGLQISPQAPQPGLQSSQTLNSEVKCRAQLFAGDLQLGFAGTANYIYIYMCVFLLRCCLSTPCQTSNFHSSQLRSLGRVFVFRFFFGLGI